LDPIGDKGDVDLLQAIRQLINVRPTCRRITALLNRSRRLQGPIL